MALINDEKLGGDETLMIDDIAENALNPRLFLSGVFAMLGISFLHSLAKNLEDADIDSIKFVISAFPGSLMH